ncbi:MAG: hypothetical protein ACE5IO_09290 [Thermoplasmata archaeon]
MHLDKVLYDIFDDVLVLLESTELPPQRLTPRGYDLIVVSDIKAGNASLEMLDSYLKTVVRLRGAVLVLTGGYGLTRLYSDALGTSKLGCAVGGRRESLEIMRGTGVARHFTVPRIPFMGHNVLTENQEEETWSTWDPSGDPALIVHRYGKGNVVVFSSDCPLTGGVPRFPLPSLLTFGPESSAT